MLVLARKAKQTVMIGEAKVTITRISGNTVRVGIEAPEGVRVLRGELIEGVQPCKEVENTNLGSVTSPQLPNEKTKTKEAA